VKLSREEIPTIKLDVIGPTTSIEYLNADFASHEARCVHSDNGQYTFDDLPANNGRFRKASAHDEHVAAKALLSEDVLYVANKVPALISLELKMEERNSPRYAFVENQDLDVWDFMGQSSAQIKVILGIVLTWGRTPASARWRT
jgi:hypothetical protein